MIPKESRSTHNLVCCLVNEVCKDGQRTLFHNSERELVNDKNEKADQLQCAANNMQCRNTQKE